MNNYGASDLMRNVFKEAAETRANAYLNKRERNLGNSEDEEKLLRGRLIQKGKKPTKSGELKFPNGRKYNVSYEDSIHDFGKDLKKKMF